MLAAYLVVGRKYAQRAKPQDAESPLRKIIFVGPARAGKAKIRHAAAGDLDGLGGVGADAHADAPSGCELVARRSVTVIGASQWATSGANGRLCAVWLLHWLLHAQADLAVSPRKDGRGQERNTRSDAP